MNLQLSDRNKRMREKLIATDPIICPERAVIWTETFQKYETKPPILKAALALKATLEQMTIMIHEDELIVGNQGNGLRAATLSPLVNTWVVDELDQFEKRDGSVFRISEQTKEKVREVYPYWEDKSVYNHTMAILDDEAKDAMDALVFTCGYTLTKGCGHWLLNFENVLRMGFRGIRQRAEEKLAGLDFTDPYGVDKIPLYQAIIITCDGVRRFAERYSALAREMAKSCCDPRKSELETIADICAKVPYEPPRTFREAVQTIFFMQLIVHIESDGTGISLGRLDHILYPYYQRDMDAGRITKEEAEELLDNLWLKIGSIIQVWNEEDSKAFGGHPISQAVTIGGQDAYGNDDTNALSYMMLETTARVHMPQPSVCVRVNRNTPEALLLLSAEVIREGIGMPAMYNDEIAIPSLTMRGISLEDAREYYGIIGCVEMGIQGKLNAFANSGYFNLAKTLELTLHDGYDPVAQKQIGKQTGRPENFMSYEALENAFFEQMRHLVKYQVEVTNVVDTMHARIAPLPFISAITDDCIEKGLEVQSGGAKYNYDGIQACGFADAVDSLAAMKKLVFEEKTLTMKRLIEAIDADFVGYEDVRLMVSKKVVKYGNNDQYVDKIARRVAYEFCHAIEQYKNIRGGFFVPGVYSNSANVPLGAACGALPNGRRAFKPVAEACSPSHGAEKNGPTQAALSVAGLDHLIITNGSQYNQKYHPSALAGEKGLRSLVDVIETFFEAGGYHIQFNVVSADTLRAAQREPQAYRDLVVRVAGYTAFFVDLNREIQNDIIDRTEMEFA